MTPRRSIIPTIAVTLLALVFCSNAWAQNMYASVYSDYGPGAWGDDLWIDSWATGESNSGNCDHMSFQTTATVISPTARSYTNTMFQLSSAASLQFQEEEGDWEVTSLLEFECSCDGTVGVSFGTMVPALFHQTFFTDVTRYSYPVTACVYHEYACTSGTPVCGDLPWPLLNPPPFCPPFIQANFVKVWMGFPGWVCVGKGLVAASGGTCF